MTDTPRSTLRDLPLPAKLVVTVFLLSVGVGYFSALVQIHFQHSDKNGEAMPTPANVVAVFAGKKWDAGGGEVPKSRLEVLLSGQKFGSLTSSNMTPAFFNKCEIYQDEIAKGRPKAVVDDEREGERRAVIAWSKLDPGARQAAYDKDAAELPAELVGKPVPDVHKINPKTVKIKSILKARCESCHAPKGEKSDIPLDNYDALEKLMKVAAGPPPGGGWVDSGKQMSLVKLTQSTHAHLLSFSMLFALTGLVFAFTNYPTIVRCVLAPLVLVAQVVDVACWWLARLEPPYGPNFALCILATGGVVGMGLAAQILLSLFNMYGRKGKIGMLLVFLIAGAGGAWVGKVVMDYLAREKAVAAVPAPQPPAPEIKPPPVAKVGGPSHLETILTGAFPNGGLWSGKNPGGMVRAFFDKEEDVFKRAYKDKTPELAQLMKERATEQALVLAWVKSPDDARKQAYEMDSFAIPDSHAKNPLTAEFKAGTAVKVKSLLNSRCVGCHSPGGEKGDVPLETYDKLVKYFGPPPPGGK
ncbi:MAG TPA: hypothetical protein VMZ71_12230, partial [Gemmataceae bacterium]|nr:hypothetical protein [Gemmataceae bacterium]